MKYSAATISSYPVTFSDIKAWLRLDFDTEKPLIDNMIKEAFAFVENEVESTIVQRACTVVHYADTNTHHFALPRGPVASVTTIVDKNSVALTDYDLEHDGNDSWVYLRGNFDLPITITYSAGYSTLPFDLKRAICILVGHWFRNRDAYTDKSINEIGNSMQRIFDNYRRSSFVR